jgi:hypothetical protein
MEVSKLRKLTEAFARTIQNSTDFGTIKDAVMQFITALDTEVYILNDGDLAELFFYALERRGKDIEQYGIQILRGATAMREARQTFKSQHT